jgi:hypothetical protein
MEFYVKDNKLLVIVPRTTIIKSKSCQESRVNKWPKLQGQARKNVQFSSYNHSYRSQHILGTYRQEMWSIWNKKKTGYKSCDSLYGMPNLMKVGDLNARKRRYRKLFVHP